MFDFGSKGVKFWLTWVDFLAYKKRWFEAPKNTSSRKSMSPVQFISSLLFMLTSCFIGDGLYCFSFPIVWFRFFLSYYSIFSLFFVGGIGLARIVLFLYLKKESLFLDFMCLLLWGLKFLDICLGTLCVLLRMVI